MNYLNLVKKFISEECVKNGKKRDIKHYERTLYWLLQLKPDADEAEKIAAFAHDAERVFRSSKYQNITKSEKGFQDEKHLKHHQEEGVKIISGFLLKNNTNPKLVNEVSRIILKHEVGGDNKQNLLKDADSISFFETNIGYFLTRQVEKTSKNMVRNKFDWMYNRITSPKAKAFCKNWYQEAISRLG